MSSYRGFQVITPTDQNTFPYQQWNVASFHEKDQKFCINSFTSQFYAKNFKIKKFRSGLIRPENHQICHKYNQLRNPMVNNLNFNNGYVYFDTIFIYGCNTFLSSIVLC